MFKIAGGIILASGADLDEYTLYVDVSKMRFLRPRSVDN
jgi:hypothetical protein